MEKSKDIQLVIYSMERGEVCRWGQREGKNRMFLTSLFDIFQLHCFDILSASALRNVFDHIAGVRRNFFGHITGSVSECFGQIGRRTPDVFATFTVARRDYFGHIDRIVLTLIPGHRNSFLAKLADARRKFVWSYRSASFVGFMMCGGYISVHAHVPVRACAQI